MKDRTFLTGMIFGIAITLATVWFVREVTDVIVKYKILENERLAKPKI